MSGPALTLAALRASPNALAPHYSRFRVDARVLLTGHSHQAWPDVSREAQVAAWDDAARDADDKWARAFEQADRVREGFARRLGARAAEIALGQNTFELVTRFLSALPLDSRPRLVTTDGEFHTLRRLLGRLAETRRLEVVKLPARPAGTLSARLAAAVDTHTAAVLVSSVLFETAEIVPGLGELSDACRREGAELLVDAYHQVNAVPANLGADGLGEAFVVGGGYKYCQLGEGNCFLRVPPGRDHYRPVLTGWFSEFARLSQRAAGEVPYGEGPARWAGSTWDPSSHYRGARVFEFFDGLELSPEFLREVSQHQVARLAAGFDALGLDEAIVSRDGHARLEHLGGFLAIGAPQAGLISKRLRERGVWTDFRGESLRLGPAPYLSDAQLDEAIDALRDVVAAL